MNFSNRYHVNEFLSTTSKKDDFASIYILILLNSDTFDANIVAEIWNNFSHTICADGGANRLYDCAPSSNDRSKYIPHAIVGDLDSLRPEVRQFYRLGRDFYLVSALIAISVAN